MKLFKTNEGTLTSVQKAKKPCLSLKRPYCMTGRMLTSSVLNNRWWLRAHVESSQVLLLFWFIKNLLGMHGCLCLCAFAAGSDENAFNVSLWGLARSAAWPSGTGNWTSRTSVKILAAQWPTVMTIWGNLVTSKKQVQEHPHCQFLHFLPRPHTPWPAPNN